MALHALTKWQLIEQIGLLGFNDMNAWVAGIATGGSLTTFVDEINRLEQDDFFNTMTPKARIHIYSTTDGLAPQGMERMITDWVQSTATGTFSPALPAAIGADDKYVILSQYTWDEITAAINAAIDEVAGDMLIYKTDETITLAAGAYEYILPEGFVYITNVSVADAQGQFNDNLDWNDWRIIHAELPKLQLIRTPKHMLLEGIYQTGQYADTEVEDGRTLRIEGLGAQGRLVDDNDICNLDPTFVVNRAAELLHGKRVRRSDTEPDAHATQMQIYKARADAVLAKKQTVLPPNARRVELG